MKQDRFEEYIKGCLITWNSYVSWEQQVLNCTLGLAGEVIEFKSELADGRFGDDLISEAGDVLYYSCILLYQFDEHVIMNEKERPKLIGEGLANYYDNIIIYDTASFDQEATFIPLLRHIGYILESVKKGIYHNKQMDYTQLRDSILFIQRWLVLVLERYNITLDTVMTFNFEKLRKRYPEGFAKLDTQSQ